MKKFVLYILCATLPAVAFTALGPRENYTSDTSVRVRERTLEVNQASSWQFGWTYTNKLTSTAHSLTGATATVFNYYPTNQAWMVSITGTIENAAAGKILHSFTPAQLNTNGAFKWRSETTGGGETLGYAFGDLIINKDYGTGTTNSLPTNGVINWSAYNYQNTAASGPYRAGSNITFTVNADGSVDINKDSGSQIAITNSEWSAGSSNYTYQVGQELFSIGNTNFYGKGVINSISNDLDTAEAAIVTETNRAIIAEANLQSQITSNDTDIATNAANIAIETNRAIVAEANLQSQITSNDTDIATNAANIAIETNRAITAEALNATNLASVSNDLDTAETALVTETNRAITAEGVLTTNLGSVSNDLDTAEAAIVTETNRAITAESLIISNLASVSNAVDVVETNAFLKTASNTAGADTTNAFVTVTVSGNLIVDGTNVLDNSVRTNDTRRADLADAGRSTSTGQTFTSRQFIIKKELDDTIAAAVDVSLYGATNAHPTLSIDGSLWSALPGTTWSITNALSVGTNLIGTWGDTNPVVGNINSGKKGLHWHAYFTDVGSATVTHYVEYVMLEGDTTNGLITSAALDTPEDSPLPVQAYAHLSSNVVCTGTCYQAVSLYAVRVGGASANYIILGGSEDYDSHFSGSGVSGGTFQPYSADLTTIAANGEAHYVATNENDDVALTGTFTVSGTNLLTEIVAVQAGTQANESAIAILETNTLDRLGARTILADFDINGFSLISSSGRTDIDDTLYVTNGNVGIGTDTPGAKLHVVSTGTDTNAIFAGGLVNIGGSFTDINIPEIDGNLHVDGTLEVEAQLRVGTSVTLLGNFVTHGSATFNDSAADRDFRIGSDTDAYAFFLQGSDGAIGIGTNTPGAKFHVIGNVIIDDGSTTAAAVTSPFKIATDEEYCAELISENATSAGLLVRAAHTSSVPFLTLYNSENGDLWTADVSEDDEYQLCHGTFGTSIALQIDGTRNAVFSQELRTGSMVDQGSYDSQSINAYVSNSLVVGGFKIGAGEAVTNISDTISDTDAELGSMGAIVDYAQPLDSDLTTIAGNGEPYYRNFPSQTNLIAGEKLDMVTYGIEFSASNIVMNMGTHSSGSNGLYTVDPPGTTNWILW